MKLTKSDLERHPREFWELEVTERIKQIPELWNPWKRAIENLWKRVEKDNEPLLKEIQKVGGRDPAKVWELHLKMDERRAEARTDEISLMEVLWDKLPPEVLTEEEMIYEYPLTQLTEEQKERYRRDELTTEELNRFNL